MQHKLLLSDELRVGGRGSCGFGGHEDGAGGRDAGGEAGCVHGRHGHVGIVRCWETVVGTSRVKWHHLAVHQLLHGKLVSLLRPPPLCSPVLEPNLL